MSAADYERKSHLKYEIFIKMLYPVQTSRARCASNNISRDNETFLLVAAFYTQIWSFWERPYSHEGNKLAVVLVT